MKRCSLLLLLLIFFLSSRKEKGNTSSAKTNNAKLGSIAQKDPFGVSRKSSHRPMIKSKTSIEDDDVPTQNLKSSPLDRNDFYRGLDTIFTPSSGIELYSSEKNDRLMEINRYGIRGVEWILEDLRSEPKRESEVTGRMTKIDYLGYRSRWDPETTKRVASFLREGLKRDIPLRSASILIAERAELIGRISAHLWSEAAEIIRDERDPLVKDLALYESYHALLQSGLTSEESLDFVQSIDHRFSLKGSLYVRRS